MMKCGHSAQATKEVDGKRVPVCVICVGTVPSAEEVVELSDLPNLDDRLARCLCGETIPSSFDLAFFEFRGENSNSATNSCECGFFETAHHITDRKGGWCDKFTSRGPDEFDIFYCGCRGWD